MTFSPWDALLLYDAKKYSNFQSFLDSVSPKIPSKPLSKARVPILNGIPQPVDQEIVESFSLTSLWKFYTESSYFGTGVPILLNDGEGIVQYYCPSLSALQIYTIPISATKQDSDSWSDESENDEFSTSLSNNSSKSSDVTSEDFAAEPDASYKTTNPFGDFYCEFNETLNPHQRIPFTEKINQLAQKYPDLLKLESIDLSPYSWMAVAWYPIYQIPLTKNVKALSACFVTYHSLSTSKGLPIPAPEGEKQKYPWRSLKEKEGLNKPGEIALPPFAATSYKMNGGLWTNPMTSDEEKITRCLNAATSWVNLLDFQHHDFNFYKSRMRVN